MKPRKIAVLGVGHVGAHVASSLITQGIADELVLIDSNAQKVASEVQDLRDSMLWMDNDVKVNGGDFKDLADCDILINCVGNIGLLRADNDRIHELAFNVDAVNGYADKIRESGFDGIIINISNPCDVITRQLAVKTGLPQGHVFGTGTALDTSRLISELSRNSGISEKSITGYMFGEHGNHQFSPRSILSFAGARPEDFFEEEIDWDQLTTDAVKGGWVTFAGKYCTEYGIAATAARLAKAVLEDEKKIVPVSAPLNGEYGQSDVFAGIPCVIGRNGVECVLELPLTDAELEQFASCCDAIRDNIATADKM